MAWDGRIDSFFCGAFDATSLDLLMRAKFHRNPNKTKQNKTRHVCKYVPCGGGHLVTSWINTFVDTFGIDEKRQKKKKKNAFAWLVEAASTSNQYWPPIRRGNIYRRSSRKQIRTHNPSRWSGNNKIAEIMKKKHWRKPRATTCNWLDPTGN